MKDSDLVNLYLEIITRSMLCITELHNKFYVEKVKTIKPSIYNNLTPVGLAHWIIGMTLLMELFYYFVPILIQ